MLLIDCMCAVYQLVNILLILCIRASAHASPGVPRAASAPEHVAAGVGLWTAQHTSRGALHQADGQTLCEYKESQTVCEYKESQCASTKRVRRYESTKRVRGYVSTKRV